jgi:heme-degrading monooxygenase HmoA
MAYIRISYMTPRTGQEARVAEILGQLAEAYSTQPGYIQGYVLHPVGDGGATRRLGRVGVWATEHDAETAGQHAIALRSELIPLVDEDSHTELGFEGEPDVH